MTLSDFAQAVFHLPYTERVYLRASPDGKWVAWTWFGVGEAAKVFAVPTDGSRPPVQLTDSAEISHLLSWSPDSRSVLVARDHQGDERYRLYRVEVERPLQEQLLTDPDPHYFLRGGELHPNGRWLVYGANYDYETGSELEGTWLWRQDLITGERRALARPTRTSYFNPSIGSTGDHVLYHRAELHPAGRQAWLVDIEGKTDRELHNAGADKYCNARWFPDGRRVLLVADTATHTRIGVHDLAAGTTRWLIDDPTRCIENAFVPFGSDKIVVIEARDARYFSSLLDPDAGSEFHLPPAPGSLYLLAPLGGDDWLAHYAVSRQPDDFVRLSLQAAEPEQFVSLARVWDYTPLTRRDFTPAQDFRWRSVDGLEIQGWLYRAQNPRGTVVYVHGGPTYHHEDRMIPEIQYYVRAGFHVLDPNYRGSTGFGFAYREAIKKEGWGGLEQEDIRTGIEALIRAGIAVPGRVGITGTSYGGYSAWHAITHLPTDLVAAAAPICGMTDLVIDYETTRPDLRPYSEEMMGGSPSALPEKYRERSPIHFVENIRGTLLIVQGMRDPNVTPENVRAVIARLQDAGIEYGLLTFEDEGHGIYKPRNLALLCERIVDTFTRAFDA
jgi:dipeptidyl aminopeptidase/acylaminoacyl peptidase